MNTKKNRYHLIQNLFFFIIVIYEINNHPF